MKLYRPVGQKTLWPLNSIYLSISPTNPSTYFGGTWVQLKNAFLFATNATSGNKGTGSGTGTSTGSTTLTTEQIPSHTHTQKSCTDSGNHEHSVQTFPYGGSDASYYCISTSPGGNVNSSINWRGGLATGSGNHNHTVTLNNTGGGKGHTHTVPYIEIYVFKRTA